MKIDFCKNAKTSFDLVKQFEDAFALKIGAKHCVAVNSGYSALFLTLWAMGIRKGDEVIMPDFTMIATAHAVDSCGAKSVFVDVELDTGNIDAEKIEKAITKNTKAIISVHIYGHPCDMADVNLIARKYNLKVIEDAAEAHGAQYRGKYTGTLADAGCFSFYANKIISTGEGGAVTTDNDDLADEIRKLRSYHFAEGYKHQKKGWSFRMNPFGASNGIESLEAFDTKVEQRRRIADFYNRYLSTRMVKPVEKWYAKNVYWMYGIRTEEKEKLKKHLAEKGIETRDFFYPMSGQPMYETEKQPIAWELNRTGLLLPSMPSLTKEELGYICDNINLFYD